MTAPEDATSTLDFLRLSNVVLKLDGAMEDRTVPETMVDKIDYEALTYMAFRRAEMLLRETGIPQTPAQIIAMLTAAFSTGVVTGIEFEQAGGHRDG